MQLLPVGLLEEVHGPHQSLFGELFELQDPTEVGASEPAAHVIQAAVIKTMGVDHAQDFVGVRTKMLGQADFLGQMMQD